ncbi:MAG TPA: hypothetical protein VMU09_10290 [Acidimicrobiales bacterium]|nr:hypothetical protein [Acidimicrobiales bacterium]
MASRRAKRAAVEVAAALGLVFAGACSTSHNAASTTTTTSAPASASSSTSSTSTTTASGAHTVALGTVNPAQGDCTTNTSEAATAVGSVVLTVTASSYQADVTVQSGPANTGYGVFMQQVPGSCPQNTANGGALTTNASGRGHAVTSVPRVAGATTFFVQLVPNGAGPPTYTSDRISTGP